MFILQISFIGVFVQYYILILCIDYCFLVSLLCICGIFVTVHLILFVLLLFLWIFNTFSTSPVHVSTNAN